MTRYKFARIEKNINYGRPIMSLSIVILAAGEGKRMKSATAKVMHHLAGRPLLEHVIDAAIQLNPNKLVVVAGNDEGQVVPFLECNQIETVIQNEQLGTGHALMQAKIAMTDSTQVLVLYGDVPLTKVTTLQALIDCADQNGIGILTTKIADPTGYGRIVRNDSGRVKCITEQKDADERVLAIKEVNSGIMLLPSQWMLSSLDRLGNDNAQGEYYLTDIIALAVADGIEVNTICCIDEAEVAGVNTRCQLAKLERHYQALQADRLMTAGVTLADPNRIDVRGELNAGNDIFIDINVIFEGKVSIASHVSIGANCIIKDSEIAEGSVILPNSMIDSSVVGAGSSIGPFARLRPGTILREKAKIGNFVEVKNTNVGVGSKVNHLSYIGDTDMGAGVNIGAGTITCNYDGVNKHRTVIGDNAFIGSDTQLVAPVTVGEGSTIGAGTTLRKDAPAGQLTLTKNTQRTVEGWKSPGKK